MTTKEVKVHYVGRGVYNRNEFVKEAEQIGVSRAFPLYVIKRMKRGQPIYLAQWQKTGEKEFVDRQYSKTKKVGKATIFGYYFVEGFNIPKDILDSIGSVIDISEPVAVNQTVKRKCGKYIVVSQCTTSASIEEIITAIEDYIEFFDPKQKKIMVTGSFVKLKTPIVMEEELFCRTLRSMDIPISDIKSSIKEETEINGIKGYKQTTYYPKGKKVVGSK